MPLRYTSSVFARSAGLTNAHIAHSTGKQKTDDIFCYLYFSMFYIFHPPILFFLQFGHISYHQLGNGFDINHIDSYSEYKQCDTMLANVIKCKVMKVQHLPTYCV